jgi:hypothetical protein
VTTQPQPEPDEVHVIQWTHPHRGRLRWVLCTGHERTVLRALKRLGIGCSGSQASTDDGPCQDCAAEVPV